MPGPDESFKLRIENHSSETEQYLVVLLFDGSPESLPMRGDVLDVSRSGVTFDSEAPEVATFGIAYSAGEVRGEGGEGFQPAAIDPRESQTVTIGDALAGGGGPGRYVVLSYLPGHYEDGNYVAFTLTNPEGEAPTMGLRPSPPGSSALEVGETLDHWSGTTLDGGSFDSTELSGAQALIVVLTDQHDLAAEALDIFSSLADDLDDEIRFVAVDTFEGVDRTHLLELIGASGIDSPVVFDSSGALAELAKPDGPGIYWIFTDGTGKVKAIETGVPEKGELAALFD